MPHARNTLRYSDLLAATPVKTVEHIRARFEERLEAMRAVVSASGAHAPRQYEHTHTVAAHDVDGSSSLFDQFEACGAVGIQMDADSLEYLRDASLPLWQQLDGTLRHGVVHHNVMRLRLLTLQEFWLACSVFESPVCLPGPRSESRAQLPGVAYDRPHSPGDAAGHSHRACC